MDAQIAAQFAYLHRLMFGAYCLAGLGIGVAMAAVFYVSKLVRDVRQLKRQVRVLLKDEGVEINWHQGQSDPPPSFR